MLSAEIFNLSCTKTLEKGPIKNQVTYCEKHSCWFVYLEKNAHTKDSTDCFITTQTILMASQCVS